jgi:hypothetical protein
MKKLTILGVASMIGAFGFCYWQYDLYSRSNNIVDFLIEAGEACKSGNKSICAVLPSTKRNLDSNMDKLIYSLADRVGEGGRYEAMARVMLETKSKADDELKKNASEARFMEREAGVMSEMNKRQAEAAESMVQEIGQFRREYDQLARPKILYSCDGKISYMAGKGISNYNDLYEKAKSDCPRGWEFKILDSDK